MIFWNVPVIFYLFFCIITGTAYGTNQHQRIDVNKKWDCKKTDQPSHFKPSLFQGSGCWYRQGPKSASAVPTQVNIIINNIVKKKKKNSQVIHQMSGSNPIRCRTVMGTAMLSRERSPPTIQVANTCSSALQLNFLLNKFN